MYVQEKGGCVCVCVSNLCVICTSAHHYYVNVNTYCWKVFFFFFFVFDTTYTYISPPPLLISQGAERCDDFNITCVWCSFCKRCYEFFFFLPPCQLKRSLVFKLLCCSGFPLLPLHMCSPIVATVVGTSSGKEGHLSLHFCLFGLNVATADGGGHLKKKKTVVHAIVFSNSPPNLWHL